MINKTKKSAIDILLEKMRIMIREEISQGVKQILNEQTKRVSKFVEDDEDEEEITIRMKGEEKRPSTPTKPRKFIKPEFKQMSTNPILNSILKETAESGATLDDDGINEEGSIMDDFKPSERRIINESPALAASLTKDYSKFLKAISKKK